MQPTKSSVLILVGGADVTSHVVFAQTQFQAVAGAQPGTCQVTLRDPYGIELVHTLNPLLRIPSPYDSRPDYRTLVKFIPGSAIIELFVDGRRMWQGYPFQVEQGYIFADDPEPKLVLHGIDLNILFDKLIMYNHANPALHPDGGGTYEKQKVTVNGQVSGHVVSVPKGTWDVDYIQTMMADFDIDLVSPDIKYGQGIWPAHDTRMTPISQINMGDLEATWTPPNSGTTLRAFFQDVSNNIVRSQPGSAVWYIDPDGYIVWKDQDTDRAPFQVGDTIADGVVPARNLSVTTDVSRLKNDVLVFTGTLDPTPQSTQEFLRFVHKINNPSVNLFGRFQWSEVMGSDWLQGMINARAKKVLTQEGTPAMKADFTIYEPGLYPGQIVDIFSDEHTFILYDPTFGLREQDYVTLPIRAVDMSFPTPDVVEYRATCSYDTQDPWGLLLALKRPSTRGLVQPNFNIIDLRRDTTYIEASPMVLVKEYAQPISGNQWQLTYAYVANSITLVVKGLRQYSVPDDVTGAVGFVEISPDKGIIKLSSKFGPSTKVYVEYHVWHNLVD